MKTMRVTVADPLGPTGDGELVKTMTTPHHAALVKLDSAERPTWVLGAHVQALTVDAAVALRRAFGDQA